MKDMNKMYTSLTLLVLLFTIGLNSSAQQVLTAQKAQEKFTGIELIRESNHSEIPSYLRFQKEERIAKSELKNWLKENIGLDSEIGFKTLTEETDEIGFIHTRMQQTFKGFPIESAIWLSHSKNNRIHSMNGMIFKTLTAPSTPTISENQALEYAKIFVGADVYKWELPEEEAHIKWESDDPTATHFPKGELVFAPINFGLEANNYRLAYKFDIYAQSPLYRAYVFVDAITGEIILENGIIHHADTPGTAVTAYSGSRPIIADSFGGSFRLRDASRGLGVRTFDLNNAYGYGGAVDFTDADNNWNNVNPQQDEYATDAHWGTEMSYDYYNDIHGRNSLDDAGFQLNSYVHYGVNYVNAYWDGTRMTYGDGNGAPYTPLTSIDIAGHELTHGLTNFTANLIYFAESGALNESFSDIFGTAIENYARPGAWDWLLSADIGASFRSLENPNLYGHPDTYMGVNWAPLAGPDNGGVHTNSGVQNFWYYLLVEGGSGTNDIGDAYLVNGLGFTAASAISFRNLTVYLSPGSNYADARFYAIQSAIDLYGECSDEEIETTNAWYAVGVGPEYDKTLISDFTSTTACFPGDVAFTDISSGLLDGVSDWDWDFGDGGTSDDQNPIHGFPAAGTYTVELFVSNGTGCDATTTIDIEILEGPGVAFSSTNFCLGETTEFTDETTIGGGGILGSWDWDFDDGGISGLQNPTHVFATEGDFDVKLIVTSDNGCIDSLTETITISAPPTADFSFINACFPDGEVEFTDLSITATGVIDTWAWNFGDGGTAAVANPTHIYAGTGTYPVELTVTTDIGCSNVFTYDLAINDLPVVNFSFADLCEGDLTNFIDETTIAAGAIIGWEWDFDDGGATSALEDPNYAFGSYGDFDVKLIATSDNGCADSITQTVTISPNPVAEFTFDDDCFYTDALFANTSTIPGGGLVGDYVWDFGDGSPADMTESPGHAYAAAGDYDVTLVVTSPEGCTNQITHTISRFESPVANFSVDNICEGFDANFVDLSTVPAPEVITGLDWLFGDGATGIGGTPTHPYLSSGIYNVTLTATSSNGCESEIILPLEVYPAPVADFSAEDACINGGTTSFTDLSTLSSGAITIWDWDFGDGTTSGESDPVKNFSLTGTFNTELTVTSEFGCENTVIIPINIFEKPNANFTSDLTAICSPDCIQFTDLSNSPTSGISNWKWTIESGDISFDQNPKICFNALYDNQLYDVELIVTNDFGCKDTINVADFVDITATPIASFNCTTTDIDIFDPTVTFINTTISGYSYTWNFGDHTAFSNVSDPSHTYPETPGDYDVILEAKSQNGLCSSFATKRITVKDVIIYYIPNTFTPDGDTYNETFSPSFASGYDPYDFHLVIFNRWGEIVFETYNAYSGWDGTYGTGGLANEGVYVWQLDFRESMTDKRHSDYGHVTLLK